MTDAEAREVLEYRATWCEAMGAPGQLRETRAIRHALAAISDRATLVKIADKGWPGFAELDAARRHMRGEP